MAYNKAREENGGSGKKLRKNSCGVWVSGKRHRKAPCSRLGDFQFRQALLSAMQETGTYLEEVAAI